MKKITRFLSLIVLLGILLSLCGCSYLDELRASRAYGPKNGAIVLDGAEYKILPSNQYFSPDMGGTTDIYVVEDEEVPLLLIDLFGDYGYKSEDGRFLSLYSESGRHYYCRAELYDDLQHRLTGDFQPEGYTYSYYDYEADRQVPYIFTAHQAEALETVLSTQEPYQLPSNTTLNYQYSVSLYQCSSDLLFRKYMGTLYYNEGRYYITIDSRLEQATYIYDVPQELTLVFAGIMEKKVNG